MTDKQPILIELVSSYQGQWMPLMGPETSAFLATVVPEESRDSVQHAASSILSRSIPPTGKGDRRETGLVVGYIQSGKTMSFEAVTTLARDNKFQVVIIIAGTTTALLEQSTKRLRRDLQIDNTNRPRHWVLFENPSADKTTIIRDVLEDWRDPNTPKEQRRTILITVLKHHHRLQELTDLILKLDVKEVPFLIVDDEADQASLNVEVAQGEESTTYHRLMKLRQALPIHTYLQYTATPQAPLLVSIIDSLSPNFVQVLEPGDAYVGGKEFFDEQSQYTRIIPPPDVLTGNNPIAEPPESLLVALRVFLLGVTAAICQGHNTGNRSMLVHPSHLKEWHKQYHEWVSNVLEDWKRTLGLSDNEPDKQELVEDFRSAYDDLKQTVGSALPSFDELVSNLPRAFRSTRVFEVNTREQVHTPRVEWSSSYGCILVGGQAMDRGFTVEGLTVTYMPRGIGVGNADTIQQRARFFGYKRQYLDYCRVWLEEETLVAFQAYVEHEENIHAQLKEFQENNRPLNDWKRAFILDTSLKPCRQQVLDLSYMRGHFSDDWITPRVVSAPSEIAQENRQTVDEFLQGLSFRELDGHPDRTPVQRHHVCNNIPLEIALKQLLIKMRITGTKDSQRNTGLLLLLQQALEINKDELCTIYLMSPAEGRQRSVNETGEITNLFQGAAPVNPPEQRGKVYPGDRDIRDDDKVTIQIHNLNLMQGDAHKLVNENIPILAVWVPKRLSLSWIVQGQS